MVQLPTNPRSQVQVLATLDETSYSGGEMSGDHPIAWYHSYSGGRAWYTAGGHTSESFDEPLFRQHLLGGILWAAGVSTTPTPTTTPTAPSTPRTPGGFLPLLLKR